MTLKILVNPFNHCPIAELVPGKKVTILDEDLLNRLNNSGITVSREFKEKYKINWRVYPNDPNTALFAFVFEQFYFARGLQQQGFYWQTKEQLAPKTDPEIAQEVLRLWKQQQEATPNED